MMVEDVSSGEWEKVEVKGETIHLTEAHVDI